MTFLNRPWCKYASYQGTPSGVPKRGAPSPPSGAGPLQAARPLKGVLISGINGIAEAMP
jgi:hypothetical protein